MKTFRWRTIVKNLSAKLKNTGALTRNDDVGGPTKALLVPVNLSISIQPEVYGVEKLIKEAILNNVWTVVSKSVRFSPGAGDDSFALNVKYYTIATDKIGQLVDTINSLAGVEGVLLIKD